MSTTNALGHQTSREEHDRRINVLVLAVGGIAAAMLVGMLFNIPALILYTTPLLIFVFMLLGGINRRGSYRGVLGPIIGYAIVLGIIIVLMGVLQSSDIMWFGLPISTGILVYVLWPFATISSGLMYAWVYHSWLSRDVTDESPSDEATRAVRNDA